MIYQLSSAAVCQLNIAAICRLSCKVSAQLPLVKAAVRSVASCHLSCDRISLLYSVCLACSLSAQLSFVSLAVICYYSCDLSAWPWYVSSAVIS